MAQAAGAEGLHFGGSFSMIELTAVLYLEVMDTKDGWTKDPLRDRVILSKGHGIPAIYAVLRQLGMLKEEELSAFKQESTRLFGHPCQNEELGIEFSSGSLGQGLSFGVGTALALKKKGYDASRVYVVLGDGECGEGQVWEAAASAAHFGLNQITAVIDRNRLQYDGTTEEVLSMAPMEEKWRSFGWDTVAVDGHNIGQCYDALTYRGSKPVAVLADTVKGKGVSFMENQVSWHHSQLTKQQYERAVKELEE